MRIRHAHQEFTNVVSPWRRSSSCTVDIGANTRRTQILRVRPLENSAEAEEWSERGLHEVRL